jgi:hypothetical protein
MLPLDFSLIPGKNSSTGSPSEGSERKPMKSSLSGEVLLHTSITCTNPGGHAVHLLKLTVN